MVFGVDWETMKLYGGRGIVGNTVKYSPSKCKKACIVEHK
jgi:hypothetical protein